MKSWELSRGDRAVVRGKPGTVRSVDPGGRAYVSLDPPSHCPDATVSGWFPLDQLTKE
jgi:hypothetical protein